MTYKMKGFSGFKSSPAKQDSTAVRKDSTERYDPKTLEVDSTPVGSRKVKGAGYGFGAAIDSGDGDASMWKSFRDKAATKKSQELNKTKSRNSKRLGKRAMVMPGDI